MRDEEGCAVPLQLRASSQAAAVQLQERRTDRERKRDKDRQVCTHGGHTERGAECVCVGERESTLTTMGSDVMDLSQAKSLHVKERSICDAT